MAMILEIMMLLKEKFLSLTKIIHNSEKKLNTFLTNSDNENSIEMQNVSNLDSSFKNKINENNNDIEFSKMIFSIFTPKFIKF